MSSRRETFVSIRTSPEGSKQYLEMNVTPGLHIWSTSRMKVQQNPINSLNVFPVRHNIAPIFKESITVLILILV